MSKSKNTVGRSGLKTPGTKIDSFSRQPFFIVSYQSPQSGKGCTSMKSPNPSGSSVTHINRTFRDAIFCRFKSVLFTWFAEYRSPHFTTTTCIILKPLFVYRLHSRRPECQRARALCIKRCSPRCLALINVTHARQDTGQDSAQSVAL